MKAASIHEIKKELSTLNPTTLAELCLRLGKFKKENKDLLTYLLFEAADEQGYIVAIQEEIDSLFAEINTSQLYFAKKSLRKIVRTINKYSRYSSVKETEIVLRLYFCTSLQSSGIAFEQNAVINNLYHSQTKKINTIVETLHEDLQYDYLKALEKLEPVAPAKAGIVRFFRRKK